MEVRKTFYQLCYINYILEYIFGESKILKKIVAYARRMYFSNGLNLKSHPYFLIEKILIKIVPLFPTILFKKKKNLWYRFNNHTITNLKH